MRKWKDLTKGKKIIVIILLSIILITTSLYIIEVKNQNNWKTYFNCKDGSHYELNGTGYNIDDYCVKMEDKWKDYKFNTTEEYINLSEIILK